MDSNALRAPQVLEELLKKATPVQRLDVTYDQLRLIGAVVGLKKLLEVALSASKDSDKVSAAKELSRLDEPPEVIAERLRGAPFVDLTLDQLEAIVLTGEMDPVKAMKTLHDKDEIDGTS